MACALHLGSPMPSPRRVLSALILVLANPAADAASSRQDLVGGTPVESGNHPAVAKLVASVRIGDMLAENHCTGVLIAPAVVLTAAHCIPPAHEAFTAILGSVSTTELPGEQLQVVRAVTHPGWDPEDSIGIDLGLLMLERPSAIAPISLAGACTIEQHLRDGTRGLAVGFGATTPEAGGSFDRMLEATSEIVDAECDDPEFEAGCEHGTGQFIIRTPGVSLCGGDSGGPFLVATADGPRVLGIISRAEIESAEILCPPGGAALYVRPDLIRDWIEGEIGASLEDPCGSPPPPPDRGAGCHAGRGTTPVSGLASVIALALIVRRKRLPNLTRKEPVR